MAVGFPENPINKKQFVVEKKVFEYNSELGTWNVGTKGHVSANTGTVADVSDLTDTNSILTNAGRTLPVYATESALLSVNVDTIRDGQMAFVTATNNIHVFYNRKWFGAPTSAFTPPPANLVANGDFSTSDLTGWTEQFGSISIVNNALQITRELGTGWCSYYTLTGLSVGTDYTLSFDISPNASNDGMRITETLNSQVNGIALSGATSPGTTLSGTFTATQTSMYLISVLDNPGTITIDNISVEPA